MKKNKVILFLAALMISAAQISCSTDIEPLDSNIILDPDNIYNPDNPGGGDTDNPISTGDYWPMKVGNEWIFNQSSGNATAMKIIATEIINGATYFKYDQFIGQSVVQGMDFEGTVYTRKSGSNYYMRQEVVIPSMPGMLEVTVSPTEFTILKDNLGVNETWQETLNQTTNYGEMEIVTIVNVVGKILEKDATITVGTQTFTNVIKIHIKQTAEDTIINNYFWFAKDIGLIKFENDMMDQIETYNITSYQIL